jgi:4a-hydroxytetrahydrobiopterin dehydratase
MSDLTNRRCVPCEGGVTPLDHAEAEEMLAQLDGSWQLADDGKSIRREFTFRNYYETMAFVNAIAWIAHGEDHHPDLEVGHSRCVATFSTHAIRGLSENDFICAAKIDAGGNSSQPG